MIVGFYRLWYNLSDWGDYMVVTEKDGMRLDSYLSE